MKIAVDAMGGDFGPAVVVEGAVAAAREFGALLGAGGRPGRHRARDRPPGRPGPAARRSATPPRWSAWPRAPSQALRRKRDSSLRVAAELVQGRRVPRRSSRPATPGRPWPSACSCIGVLPGRGPARHRRGAAEPVAATPSCIDAGANVDPKPRHLFQFAIMGHVYARDIVGKDHPRVGSPVGRRGRGQGQRPDREDRSSSSRGSSLNFIGNVEGRDIYNGRCDVVVTDGFTGNVCLKISESLAEMIDRHDPGGADARRAVAWRARRCRGAAFAAHEASAWTTRRWAARRCSGINGAAIICHGASPVKAIKNAVRVAAEWVKQRRQRAHQDRARGRGRAGRGAGGRPGMTRAKIIGVGAYAPKRDPHQRRAREDGRHHRTSGSSSARASASATSSTRTRRPPTSPSGPPSRRSSAPTVVPEEIDFIVVGTTTRRHGLPHHRQHRPAPARLPATPARSTCYAACAGLGLQPVHRLAVHPDRQVPHACSASGAECLSRITDFTDRGTCILLADAAGAVVLRADRGR